MEKGKRENQNQKQLTDLHYIGGILYNHQFLMFVGRNTFFIGIENSSDLLHIFVMPLINLIGSWMSYLWHSQWLTCNIQQLPRKFKNKTRTDTRP